MPNPSIMGLVLQLMRGGGVGGGGTSDREEVGGSEQGECKGTLQTYLRLLSLLFWVGAVDQGIGTKANSLAFGKGFGKRYYYTTIGHIYP